MATHLYCSCSIVASFCHYPHSHKQQRLSHSSLFQALAAAQQSLDRLGLEYVDLYLIHSPLATPHERAESWRALVELRRRVLLPHFTHTALYLPPHDPNPLAGRHTGTGSQHWCLQLRSEAPGGAHEDQ